MIGGRPRVIRGRRLEELALVGEVDREPRAGVRGSLAASRRRAPAAGSGSSDCRARRTAPAAADARSNSRLNSRDARSGSVVGQYDHVCGSSTRSRTIFDARHGERELPFVVRVGRIQQHHGVARIEQRAEQIVRQLRAAHADRDVLGAERAARRTGASRSARAARGTRCRRASPCSRRSCGTAPRRATIDS